MGRLEILASLVMAIAVVSFEFNCNRDEQSCQNNGTCETNGSCTCSGHLGYKCQLDSANQGNACPEVCPTANTCVTDNQCLCPENRYGRICQFERFQHLCLSGQILINANVEGAYAVFVYNETTCPVLNDTNGFLNALAWEGPARTIDIPSDTDCGPVKGSTEAYCVEAYIRYSNNYWTTLDTVVEYCCNETVNAGVTVSAIGRDSLLEGTTIIPKLGDSSDIRVTFHNTVGSLMVNEARIGQRVQARFRLAPGADFVSLKPLRCTLQEASSSARYGIDLITQGCASDKLDTSLTYNGAGAYDLDFQVIRFISSDTLYLVCDIRLCIQENNCKDVCPAFDRGKRESSRNPVTENIVAKIKVRDPFLNERVAGDPEEDEVEAVTKATTPNLSAAVIGLAAVVIILLVLCLALAVYLTHRRFCVTPPLLIK